MAERVTRLVVPRTELTKFRQRPAAIAEYLRIVDDAFPSQTGRDKSIRSKAYEWALVRVHIELEALLFNLLIADLQRDQSRVTFRANRSLCEKYLINHTGCRYFQLGKRLHKMLERLTRRDSYLYLSFPVGSDNSQVWHALRALRNYAAHGDPVTRAEALDEWNKPGGSRSNLREMGMTMMARMKSDDREWKKEILVVRKWLRARPRKLKTGKKGDTRMSFFIKYLQGLADTLCTIAPAA